MKAKAAEVRPAEASWDDIRRLGDTLDTTWNERASALRLKRQRLTYQPWLAECKKEMGWTEDQANRYARHDELHEDRIRKITTSEFRSNSPQPSREVTEHETENAETGVKSVKVGEEAWNPDGIIFDEFDPLEPLTEAEFLHALLVKRAPPKDIAQAVLHELEGCIKLLKEITNG